MNYVSRRVRYSSLENDLSDLALTIFDTIAEMAMPEGSDELLEVNKMYRAADLKEILKVPCPAASLGSLVSRGLLEDDRDNKGKLYFITDEIYAYIEEVYFPSKDAAIGRMMDWE